MDTPESASPEARPFLGIEDLFRQGWAIFRAYPGGFVAFTLLLILVYGALTGVSAFVSASIFGGVPSVTDLNQGGEALQVLLSYLVGVPLSAGYYVVALKIARGESVLFEDFFGGFRYWLPVVLASVLVSLLVSLGLLLLIIPGIYLAVAYTLVIPAIIDGEVNVWEALEVSRKAITGRWFTTFFLLFALAILNVLGFLAFCVGILVTIPLSYCTLTALYLDLVEVTPETP